MSYARYRAVMAVLDAELAKPYVLGTSDCFFLGLRMADALDLALDLVQLYSGRYSTLPGAQKALRKAGFNSLSALFESHLNPCAPAQAQLGDLGIVAIDGAEHVAVSLGDRFRYRDAGGSHDAPIADAIAAFRTGPRAHGEEDQP